MKTTTRFMSLLAGAIFVAAACTGGGGTPAPATPGESPGETAEPQFPTADINLLLWTKEGEADGSLQFVKKLADAYTGMHPNVTFEVVNKDVELLREDFQNASLAGDTPDLLWTVADHVGPFTAADLILPLDDVVDRSTYVEAAADVVTADGTLWGAPVSFGNQLMLYWNKSIAGDAAPADSDAWIASAKQYTTGGQFGIVFNQTESFWLVPFLGGYGGSVFAEDGVTPTLDTEAMRAALQFLYDLKFTEKVTPAEADYNVADGLFKDGKAAYIINGDWTLAAYDEALGENLGVGPLPTISGGEDPKPYIAGTFLMVPKPVADDADKLTVIKDFLAYATGKEAQLDQVTTLKRLPGNAEAINDPLVTGDPLLGGAAEAAQLGVPNPTNLEMRCVFDAMTAGVRDLFSGNSDVAGIASGMQSASESCIAQLG